MKKVKGEGGGWGGCMNYDKSGTKNGKTLDAQVILEKRITDLYLLFDQKTFKFYT